MAEPDDYSVLEQLVHAYFHPDWPDDHDSEEAVLQEFARTTWRDAASSLISQVDRYIARHPDGLLAAFESDFSPMITIGENDDVALRWLEFVRDRVSAYLPLCPTREAGKP